MVDGNWSDAERRPFSYRPKHTIVTIPLKTVITVSILFKYYVPTIRYCVIQRKKKDFLRIKPTRVFLFYVFWF